MADVRLTTSSYLVLGIIDKLGEASAYDVKVEAARTVAPFWSVPHAQVYAQCDRLVEAGLLSQVRQESGRNRRVPALTKQGRAALEGWLADPEFVPVEARERGILKLWFGGRPEVLAPVQVDEHRQTLRSYEELAEEVGVGVLGALAEDDLTRTRPALLALPATAVAVTVVLACRAAHVDWTSGPALSLICMVTGLLFAGASGRILLTRSLAPHN